MAIRGKTILIIDSQEAQNTILKKMLEGQGHFVIISSTVSGSLPIIKERVPHLIMLSLDLQNENPMKLFSSLADIDPYRYIKVIAMTTNLTDKVTAKVKSFGAHNCFQSPISNNDLVQTLKKILPLTEIPPKNFSPRLRENILVCVFSGQITKINELGLNIRSKVKFEHQEKIFIKSEFLVSMNFSHVSFLVGKTSFNVEPGVYDTEIRTLGLREIDLTNIRKLKTRKV